MIDAAKGVFLILPLWALPRSASPSAGGFPPLGGWITAGWWWPPLLGTRGLKCACARPTARPSLSQPWTGCVWRWWIAERTPRRCASASASVRKRGCPSSPPGRWRCWCERKDKAEKKGGVRPLIFYSYPNRPISRKASNIRGLCRSKTVKSTFVTLSFFTAATGA